jgi:hypothetical protein
VTAPAGLRPAAEVANLVLDGEQGWQVALPNGQWMPVQRICSFNGSVVDAIGIEADGWRPFFVDTYGLVLSQRVLALDGVR